MEKKKISAEIIADSKNESGQRITTFILTFPRIILAELNTHRMFSRNSASSRAIPFNKMVESVKNDPFIPIAWQKDHSGMQGVEYFSKEDEAFEMLNQHWLLARDESVTRATVLHGINVTKQLCNRLLEPFMYHTIICTATEWENFMALRNHPAAEIHIAKVAELMLEEMNKSTPQTLVPGEWHIPFGDELQEPRLFKMMFEIYGEGVLQPEWAQKLQEMKIQIATARCARVSYQNYEGGDDYKKDIALHNRLAEMGHWSPFEHCARAMRPTEYINNVSGNTDTSILENSTSKEIDEARSAIMGWSGNFKGFIQYRKTFQGENKKDSRIQKK